MKFEYDPAKSAANKINTASPLKRPRPCGKTKTFLRCQCCAQVKSATLLSALSAAKCGPGLSPTGAGPCALSQYGAPARKKYYES